MNETNLQEITDLLEATIEEFKEVSKSGTPTERAYLQGKKDGMRLAMALLIDDVLYRPSQLEIVTAREKWRGTDIEPLMEQDQKIIVNAPKRRR